MHYASHMRDNPSEPIIRSLWGGMMTDTTWVTPDTYNAMQRLAAVTMRLMAAELRDHDVVVCRIEHEVRELVRLGETPWAKENSENAEWVQRHLPVARFLLAFAVEDRARWRKWQAGYWERQEEERQAEKKASSEEMLKALIAEQGTK
jgi:hypothetical protein